MMQKVVDAIKMIVGHYLTVPEGDPTFNILLGIAAFFILLVGYLFLSSLAKSDKGIGFTVVGLGVSLGIIVVGTALAHVHIAARFNSEAVQAAIAGAAALLMCAAASIAAGRLFFDADWVKTFFALLFTLALSFICLMGGKVLLASFQSGSTSIQKEHQKKQRALE